MKRFKTILEPHVIQSIIGGVLQGESQQGLDNFAEPHEATESSVIFLEQEKYFDAVLAAKPGLCICNASYIDKLSDKNLLIVDKPYQSVLMLISYWLKQDAGLFVPELDPSSRIGNNCELDPQIRIGTNVKIGDNCKIGKYSIIEANSVIADNCILGEGCHLFPNVSVYSDCILGNGVIIHSGTVIGSDGFGYILMGGKQQKIPQIGNVVIHDDVEIGANTTIDRATIGSTIIGEGTKIDNLVQIGHNCIIGKHCILCSQVGLAGSTITGDYVYLAGQVGVAGHLSIGDRAMIGAQSGIANDIEADGKYFGYPAREIGLTKRIMAAEKYLPEIYRAYLKSIKDSQSTKEPL